MRFLADENVAAVVVAALRAAGHDVVWVRTETPGIDDEQILARASRERRVLLTHDRDFAALAFLEHATVVGGIALIRLPLFRPEALVATLTRVFTNEDGWEGHFSVIEPTRIRRRRLPSA